MVPKLKDNLQDTGSGDWKILDNMIKSNEEYANQIYRSDISETTKHYGSVIKTGYNGNGKPYTHPIYLTNDLPGQIWVILKDLDKDKLFEYISSSACTWSDSDKIKFKKTFGQVVDWKNSEFKSGGSSNSMGYFGDSGGSFEFVETRSTHKIDKTIEWNKESVKKEVRHFSDILYVMHALFPKDSNYQDSPFLKVGEKSCLQFKNNKSIDTPYALYWRGADANIIGKNYFVESGSASILKVPFDFEKKTINLSRWSNSWILLTSL